MPAEIKIDMAKQISTDPIYSDSPEELFNRLFKILIDNKIYTPQQ